ncbi:cupin domain-containing protein [Streptomyces sp. NPDC046985]|uniref:cupin domain-containing protein n=1 Tax=Streptomyces sp. NPDC046985 TaxID=3155377 RepID=UPI0033CA1209
MPLQEINARTPRYGVTYFENGSDTPLPISTGRGPTLVLSGEGDYRYADGVVYNIKAAGLAAANAYTVIEISLTPGSNLPTHRHARYEEAFYVLEGTVMVMLDGETFEAPTGALVLVPWGVRHRIQNSSDKVVRLFNLTVPGGIEEYYRTTCSPFRALDGNDMGEAAVRTTGEQFGIEVETDCGEEI